MTLLPRRRIIPNSWSSSFLSRLETNDGGIKMGNEFDDLEKIAGEVPYVEYIFKAYKIFSAVYDFGKQSEEQKAIEKLGEEIETLKAQMASINDRVNELTQKFAQEQNKSRFNRINFIHGIAVTDLAFQLTQEPDTNELAIIANRAALVISAILIEDEDIWLWSDTRKKLSPNGQDEYSLIPPQFMLLPLGVLAWAVAVFATSVTRHISEAPTSRPSYTVRLKKFRDALSIRDDWSDPVDSPKTLPEKVRAGITVVPKPVDDWAVNGHCRFALECINRIDRTVTVVGNGVDIYLEGPHPYQLCMAPANLGINEEYAIEADYQPIQLIEMLRDTMVRLLTRGTLADPPPDPPFPGETALSPTVYAVRPNGDMVRYECRLTTHLRGTDGSIPTWKTTNKVVGRQWNSFWRIAAATQDVFFAVRDDNTILWYRHNDPVNDGSDWSGPEDVSLPAIDQIGTFVEHCFTSGDHGLYQIVKQIYSGGGPIQVNQTFRFLPHNNLATGTGGFGKRILLDSSWGDYESVFGGGPNGAGTILYALSENGELFWHQWDLDPFKLMGPRMIASGFEKYREVFSTGYGMIFGIHPNGSMDAWYLENWRDPERSHIEIALGFKEYGNWKGPVRLGPLNWNGFGHIIPNFGTSTTSDL
ncbi:hypothetical protein [Rhodococcus sp. IEGM 1307]|uniref:hypothetical protein n=1 Tax=Rhodococcus sp. IEGM 1307 TaxID=3047091 RepID=UPI0024B66012|nr:hypothetical protein [Rhodococcus sp. IEGM 1307]MDI9979428.1 hypothetical protein [Rhodococcus sp. IEGM 1307]